MNPDTINKILALMKNGYSQEQAMATVMGGGGTANPQLGPLFDDIDVSPISMSTPNQTASINTNQNMFGPQNYHDIDSNKDSIPDYLQDMVDNTNQNFNSNTGGPKRYITDFKTEDEYVDYLVTERGMTAGDAREAWREGNYNPEKGTQQGKYTPEQLEYMRKMQELRGNQNMWGSISAQGTDPMTAIFLAGNAAGREKGTKGRGLTIAAGLGKGILGGVGAFMEGLANSKTTQYAEDWYRKQQYGPDSNLYTAAPQTRNTNNVGGMKYGGLFEDGGEQEEMPETPMEEGVEEGVEQVQEPQGEQQGMIQQVAAQVAQALNQGTSPQLIIQSLVKKGMSEQQATQLVSMVVQKMQEENQSAEQETEDTEEMPEMRKGGKFKHKVGDYIKFEYGGKMKEGKIKKIENGKIYL